MNIDFSQHIKSFIYKIIQDIEFHPEKYQIQFQKIISKSEQKEISKLIAHYTSSIVYNPSNASAYYNRGLMYHKKSSYKKAVEDFSKAIELDKNFTFAYIARGNIQHS